MRWLLAVCTLVLATSSAFAADWPSLGRDRSRNPVSPESGPPIDWEFGKFDQQSGEWVSGSSRNIKWRAELGNTAFGAPVVANGLVWIGGHGSRQTEKGKTNDAALLLCFDEQTGALLYEYVSPRLATGRWEDPPFHGLSSSPLIEGDRLWFVTNRCETVCLDIGPLQRQPRGEPRVVWKVDMREKLGVRPHPPYMGPGRLCSIAPSLHGLIYVVTGNGVDERYEKIAAPAAPGLICFESQSGDIKWQIQTGANVLHGEIASPLVAEIGGRGQVIMPHGDGWLRSYEPNTGRLLWEFDVNPKESVYSRVKRSTRNYFLSTPVLYEDLVYIAGGQEYEHGEGPGRLVCVDPTKTGEVSSELAVDRDGRPLPARRLQAVDVKVGERAIPNPNSALVWDFDEVELADFDGDGKTDKDKGDKFLASMHRTLGSVAIKDGLVLIADLSGLLHCLNARTGERHWMFDLLSEVTASPLIVDDRVYLCDGDGYVSIFPLTADRDAAIKKNAAGDLVPGIAKIGKERDGYRERCCASPIYANGVLYITTQSKLFAIPAPTPPE